MSWLAGDVKEPTRLSQRVGHEVPGVVVWPLLLSDGWGGGCSEILATAVHIATLQSEGKNSIHSIHIPGIFLVSVIVHWFFEPNLITVCKFYFH